MLARPPFLAHAGVCAGAGAVLSTQASWSSLTAMTRLTLSGNAALCGPVPSPLNGSSILSASSTGLRLPCPGPPPLPPSPPTPAPPPPTPSSILLQLRQAAGASWPSLAGWDLGVATCSWSGVQCGGALGTDITSVDLSFLALQVRPWRRVQGPAAQPAGCRPRVPSAVAHDAGMGTCVIMHRLGLSQQLVVLGAGTAPWLCSV